MDPCTAIGVVSGAVTIVGLIGSTIQGLNDIRNKFTAADQSIKSLISQLSIIKSALILLDDWTKNGLVISPTQNDLVEVLSVGIDGCKEIVDALAEEVAKLVGKVHTENLGFRARTKLVWSEEAMNQHLDRLYRQVGALQFLVSAVQCQSPRERTDLLSDSKNKEIIQKIADDATTVRASRAASADNSQVAPTIISHRESTIDSRSYAVDPFLVNTTAYKRVEEYRRAVGSPASKQDLPENPVVHVDDQSDVGTVSMVEQLDERPSPTRPYMRQNLNEMRSFESHVLSEVAGPRRNRDGSQTYAVHSRTVSNEGSGLFSRIKAQVGQKFPMKSKERVTNPYATLDTASTASRRGYRGFEENRHQSINFLRLDGSTAPSLVRAAQAGSVVEVESLIDRGAEVDAFHSPSRRSALAVASHCGNDAVVDILLQHRANSRMRDASGSLPIHLAASRGHIGAINSLLRYDLTIEEKDAGGRTPLLLAASEGYLEAVNVLISAGARVTARGELQRTSLHVAAIQGDAEMAGTLIRHGAQVDAKDAQSMSALHYACENGHEAVVSLLLDQRADIELRGHSFKTPLMCAAAGGQNHIIELLIKRKANIKATSETNFNALHWASVNGHADAVQLLLMRKIPIDSVTAAGQNSLQLAVMSKNFDVVELLIRKGAELGWRCQRKYTSLHYACFDGSAEIVQFLVSHGAGIEAHTPKNGRPLHIAVSQGRCDIVKILLSHGADYDARDYREDRPLCIACRNGDIAIVEALLNAGAPLRSKFSDKAGSREDSPLCVAACYGHRTICALLIAKGASVRQKDELQWQPLRYAAYYGHPDVVELLLHHGAEVSTLGASGGWGFDVTSSRIGFTNKHEVSQKSKDRVISLLRDAELREKEDEAKRYSGSAVNNVVQTSPSELPMQSRPLPPSSSPQSPTRQVIGLNRRDHYRQDTQDSLNGILPPPVPPKVRHAGNNQPNELFGDLIDLSTNTAANSGQNSTTMSIATSSVAATPQGYLADVYELDSTAIMPGSSTGGVKPPSPTTLRSSPTKDTNPAYLNLWRLPSAFTSPD